MAPQGPSDISHRVVFKPIQKEDSSGAATVVKFSAGWGMSPPPHQQRQYFEDIAKISNELVTKFKRHCDVIALIAIRRDLSLLGLGGA